MKPGTIGSSQKSVMIVWRYHQLLLRFLINCHLLQVSRESRLSANDKGDNEMKLVAVDRYPGIYLTDEENPRKHQIEDRLINAERSASPQIVFCLSVVHGATSFGQKNFASEAVLV